MRPRHSSSNTDRKNASAGRVPLLRSAVPNSAAQSESVDGIPTRTSFFGVHPGGSIRTCHVLYPRSAAEAFFSASTTALHALLCVSRSANIDGFDRGAVFGARSPPWREGTRLAPGLDSSQIALQRLHRRDRPTTYRSRYTARAAARHRRVLADGREETDAPRSSSSSSSLLST